VRSNHGTFRFILGPGDRGEYHKVVCVSTDNVTERFGTYDQKYAKSIRIKQQKEKGIKYF